MKRMDKLFGLLAILAAFLFALSRWPDGSVDPLHPATLGDIRRYPASLSALDLWSRQALDQWNTSEPPATETLKRFKAILRQTGLQAVWKPVLRELYLRIAGQSFDASKTRPRTAA